MFCYINGGYGAPRDDRTRDALWDMIDISMSKICNYTNLY